MVDEALHRDVMALGLPVLFVGDHGQLPPIRGSLSLMDPPDVRLEQVHRQAADSPIIQLAMRARTTGDIPFGEFGPGVEKVRGTFAGLVEWTEEDANDTDTLTLCYMNATRVSVNATIRNAIGRRPDRPVRGDLLVCLRNNHDVGIHNGMVGQVRQVRRSSVRDDAWAVAIRLLGEGRTYEGLVSREQFGSRTTLTGLPRDLDQWDYGYCLTVHKAQGSEASTVFLIEERPGNLISDNNYKRWLYTGVTRATDQLYILKAGGR
jgi:exodeoxyribonuclease-5